MPGITVDFSTRELPEVSSFVASVEQYCRLIEHTAELPLHEFMRQIAASMARLYSLAHGLPDVYVHNSCDLPPSDFGRFEAALSDYFGKYNFYSISLKPLAFEKPEFAVGSLADDLGELYSDIHCQLAYYYSDELDKLEHSIWGWKFNFQAHWGEHLLDALKHIHFLLYTERIEFAKE
jgi:hypothetical protein